MAVASARWAMTAAVVLAVMAIMPSEAATDCSAALSSVTGCAAYLTNPSSTPDDKGCCQPLKTVLDTPTSFQCLCAQASNSETADLFKNALNLPKACKLDINVSEANCTNTSSTTPSTTPSTSTPSTANTTTTPAGNGGSLSSLSYPAFIMAMAFLCATASLM
ncbi:hypothetical protein L7F22_063772 [Adiantum nelumboides]|nr:hypothetical protein [Adiantum nelumboides]